MITSIDTIIFLGFLVVNIVLGLASSRGIKTIEEYAIGNRNFSTATIAATLVATWASGEFFYSNIFETYTKGLHAMWIALGDPLYLLFIGIFFAPRMGEFLGNLSIAEAMGDLYGDRVRVITAIASFIGTAGLIAIQLKLAGLIFEWALGLSSIYGIISAAAIVTLYSSLGGIKSVVFTDVIQFFTFGTIIPLIAYVIFTSIDNVDIVTKTLTNSPLFDYKEVFDFSKSLPLKQLFLFLVFILPGFSPAIFQRVAMAKDTKQVSRSFIIAAITCLLLGIIINWISVLTLSINPSLDPGDIVKHIILNSPYAGLKGAMLAGIMAMIMSTVDSCMNSTAVIIVHDFCKPLKIKFIKNELFSTRIVSGLIGIVSLILSLRAGSLQELLVITESLYMPVVSVPFIMAIFGFRSSEKSVLFGMVAGFIAAISWDYLLHATAVNSVPFAMLVNLIVLMGSHYLLKQPGGWVGIKDKVPLINVRNERKLKVKSLLHSLKSFSIIEICKKNCPQGDGLISIFGLFVMISTFSSVHTLSKVSQVQYSYLLEIFYPLTLCSSTALISYPLWLQSWKDTRSIGIVWNIIMFSVLICFSLFTVLISNFSEIQLMVFMINITVISALIRWQWALFTIVFGVTITTFFYQQHMPINLQGNLLFSEFKIIYLLLLVISTLVVFLKPKQEYLEETEEKVIYLSFESERQMRIAQEKISHYDEKIVDQRKEIDRLGSTTQRILNNVNHELRVPIGNVINFAEMIDESLSKESDHYLKDLSQEVLKNSNRLSTMILNMLDLAMLQRDKLELDKKKINFSELVETRVKECRKIYLGEKKINIKMEIDQDIFLSIDGNYMRQVIDNLVINAINFSKEGTININVEKNKEEVVFTIEDEGDGIPVREIYDIFTPFKMSSKHQASNAGRGVGLALCRAAINAHGGEIKARSNGIRGAKFTFVLPY
jgi:Na+/proline symporter/signal transduction histidine kinase